MGWLKKRQQHGSETVLSQHETHAQPVQKEAFQADEAAMDYFEVPVDVPPGSDGVCSDNDCPCGFPGARIPRGAGYLYVSQTVVGFRRDARTFLVLGQDVATPTLVCEQGARKRGLDLEVAAADARYWWKTGLVPLRATPLATAERR
jgi:hypothetical protein